MNILFICSATSWGGNEKWTSMAVKALSRQHSMFFVGKKGGIAHKMSDCKATLELPFKSYVGLVTYSNLRRFVIDNQIDLIISTKKKEYFLAGILSRQLGIRHLIRLGVTRKMNIPFWHRLNYASLNDGLIVNAHHIKDELLAYNFFKNKEICVVYNGIPGVDEMVFHERAPKQGHRLKIVSSGRLTRQKGFQILIDAVNLLTADIQSQIEVVLVGDGRNKSEFEKLVQSYRLEQTIRFTGFVEDVGAQLNDASVFILLSEREGISNSILEAMMHQIPVVTTNSGGIAEIIDDGVNGYFVERSPVAVAEKIVWLCKNQAAIADAGRRGFDAVKTQFGYERFCRQMNEIAASKKGQEL
jgi:glycosyltransferase involved in cell wall biosynthesis